MFLIHKKKYGGFAKTVVESGSLPLKTGIKVVVVLNVQIK